MHGQVDHVRFLADIAGYLGLHYLCMAGMNFAMCGYLLASRRSRMLWPRGQMSNRGPIACLTFGVFATGMAVLAVTGDPQWMRFVSFPQWWRDLLDTMMRPSVVLTGVLVILGVLFVARRLFVRPAVAWTLLNLALLGLGLSLTDPDFAALVAKPDNVPIVGLLFLLGFFTWLATAKAVDNDRRLAKGLPPRESVNNEKVFVWPDLVYIELICMVALTAFLFLWSVVLRAPLEAPANLLETPNPSKAPWYFLGLQEMLVYFDPWIAGVALPSLIIFGLLAIPYLDTEPQGSGYYSIQRRKFAYVSFQFGFLGLWITLMVMGTFFRGPNWNFFGMYETWDVHKAQQLDNIDLSRLFWVELLGKPRPVVPENAGFLAQWSTILKREVAGLGLLGIYFILFPLVATICVRPLRSLYARIRPARYVILVSLWLLMLLLPIKMYCRWSWNLKYFVSVPELFLNL